MSVKIETKTEWRCDLCGRTEVRVGSIQRGLPEGWIDFPRGHGFCHDTILYVCLKCVQVIVVEKEGW